MHYHVFATDYDGTLAHNEIVAVEITEVLIELKKTGRRLVLVTGRRLDDLQKIFPGYEVFDHIVAENGALIYHVKNGKEELLASAPPQSFITNLEQKGVKRLEIGKVIVATWVPYEKQVLDAIKESGIELQVIFNKGAVMVLPPGINKAAGLKALLQSLNFSAHNTTAIGDAENDTAMLQIAGYAVAVSNALPALKAMADWVTPGDHGTGVTELAKKIMQNENSLFNQNKRNFIQIGTTSADQPFFINPYRSGILLSGVSGGGKSTLTVSITESLISKGYQFCLIDPEGDYLKLPGAVIIGNETSVPSPEEVAELLKNPDQNLVICILSIPLEDRPAFFSKLLAVFIQVRNDYGHPHWILMDEAHHLIVPGISVLDNNFPATLLNFILITTTPDQISNVVLSQVGMVITIGENPGYPIEQFCKITGHPMPDEVPSLLKEEACVWDVEAGQSPFVIHYNLPVQLQQRHKKKYALGELSQEFTFTGKDNKLALRANNLMMFAHIAEGIDDDTWLYHLKRKDFENWFSNSIHDDELVDITSKAALHNNAASSKKMIIDFIYKKYTA